MALATQCPHCQTTFRVAHDQLKLRAGLVRCGSCKEIFNGIEHLLRPVDPASAATPPPAAASAAALPTPPPAAPPVQVKDEAPAPAIESSYPLPGMPVNTDSPDNADSARTEPDEPATDIGSHVEKTQTDTAPAPAESLNSPPIEEAKSGDPLLRMTLMDFADARHENDAEDDERDDRHARRFAVADGTPDELDEAMEDLQRRPWRSKKKKTKRAEVDALDEADTDDEPSFLKRGRRQQRLGPRLRMLMGLGSFVLLIGVLAQSTYIFRNQIAGWFPQTKPMLTNACAILGCHIALPAQIDAVSIESSELQTSAANQDTFVLTTLLRNRSATVQAWPYIELTLNDANEKALARRVFTPDEYLPAPQQVLQGFAATSERSIKLSFELSQLKASGYRVYVFYP
jgi:predicted Zn finger-like uncharacterized protein